MAQSNSQVRLSTMPCYRQAATWTIDSSMEATEEHFHPDIRSAYVQCEKLEMRKTGMCVIIRPIYNEVDPTTGAFYFREWRSFDGEPFKECRWDFAEVMDLAE